MVEIGGKPILWHIMKSYSLHGYNDFIILCGYKGYMIKEYFAKRKRRKEFLKKIEELKKRDPFTYNH